MKKLVAILMASLFVASIASAVVDPDTDMMGYYFDLDADDYCGSFVAGPANFYIMWTNPSKALLQGYECNITIEGAYSVTGVEWPTNATNAGTNMNQIVGYATPVPTSEATVLATISGFYMDFAGGAAYVYMNPANPSSFGGSVGVVFVEDGATKLLPIGTSVLEGPSLQINGDCIVIPTESESLGNVKSLFR